MTEQERLWWRLGLASFALGTTFLSAPLSAQPADENVVPTGEETQKGPEPVRGPSIERSTIATPDLEFLTKVVADYSLAGQEFKEDVARLMQLQHDQRKREIEGRFSTEVDKLVEEESRRRDDAIGRFEEFVKRYPDNPLYTPDALFRLAELHFEKSNDNYVAALDDYEALAVEHQAGRLEEPPPEPRQDYRRTIELFDELIRRWPDYRSVDGAHYLKGYCLLEMGEERSALDEFLALVQKHPESRFVPETWTRIGEYYFEFNQLPEAIAAYKRVLDFKDSVYYDEALYKLAWTYYRNDQYVDAIGRFRELIEFSDAQAAKTGAAGSQLRSEALEYLAISLQEDDWNGDGEADPDGGFVRIEQFVKGDKSYDQEVLEKLIDILFDSAKYEDTVKTIRYMLVKFETNPRNPEFHARMITALERMQRVDEAFAERSKLASAYGEQTPWFAANSTQSKVVSEADTLMEEALIQSAAYHHNRAQQLKKESGYDSDAIKEYGLAADGYKSYLERYPNSSNAYDLNYYYAECLFYSFRFPEAVEQYVRVRDSSLGDKYKEIAGFSAVIAHENALRDLIKAGKLESRQTLVDAAPQESETTQIAETENDGKVRVVEPDPIPDSVKQLLDLREQYVKLELPNEKDPGRRARVAYKIGEAYQDYKHFDEARNWYRWLMEHYPREDVTRYAGDAGLETYRRINDWKKMAEWADLMSQAGLGGQGFKEEIQTLKVGALFKEAERLFAEEKYEAAAEEYVRLLDENPGNKYADAALNNAGVAFEKTRRFESATKMYRRLVEEHPQSSFAEAALFRVGVNAERFYDYDLAVASHLRLVQQYEKSDKRADSLYQAALLQEQTQEYAEAAKNYERYAQMFPSRDDVAATYYRAASVYKKLKDERNEVRIHEEFVRRYGNNPANNGLVIQSLARIADVFEGQGRTAQATSAWQRVVTEFNRRGMPQGSFEAQFPAKAVFKLIEPEFQRYAALKIQGSLPNQGKTIKEMQRRIQELNRRYSEIIPYKSFDWTLAAFFRMGYIYQLFAQALYDAPIPDGFGEEEEEIYRTQLEDIAMPIEDEAVKRYVGAYEKAREFRVTNEWSKRILTALNKYKPSEYPLFKEERRLSLERPLTPPRLIGLPAPVTEPEEATPAGRSEAKTPDEPVEGAP